MKRQIELETEMERMKARKEKLIIDEKFDLSNGKGSNNYLMRLTALSRELEGQGRFIGGKYAGGTYFGNFSDESIRESSRGYLCYLVDETNKTVVTIDYDPDYSHPTQDEPCNQRMIYIEGATGRIKVVVGSDNETSLDTYFEQNSQRLIEATTKSYSSNDHRFFQ